jgi:antibiotic biosynthesis monooxygenase (ABM) superfamily enzyme
MTVYSFADAEHLDAWLASSERNEINAAAAALLAGPVREQRIASLRKAPEPVTVVFSQRIAAGRDGEFASRYREVVAALEGFPGFLGSELLPPVPGVQEDHVIVASFASRRDLDRWLESETRHAWVDHVAALIEGERTINVVGGFGGWFPAGPDRPRGPRRWKQAVAVLLALFPVSLLITAVRSEVAPDMNMVLAVFVGNVLGVAALSFFLMPLVTKWLAGWLSR